MATAALRAEILAEIDRLDASIARFDSLLERIDAEPDADAFVGESVEQARDGVRHARDDMSEAVRSLP